MKCTGPLPSSSLEWFFWVVLVSGSTEWSEPSKGTCGLPMDQFQSKPQSKNTSDSTASAWRCQQCLKSGRLVIWGDFNVTSSQFNLESPYKAPDSKAFMDFVYALTIESTSYQLFVCHSAEIVWGSKPVVYSSMADRSSSNFDLTKTGALKSSLGWNLVNIQKGKSSVTQ